MSQPPNHHHPTSPPPQQQPASPHPTFVTPNSDTFPIINDDDQYEQQQLISNLLSSSVASSPSETTSFQQVKFVSYPYFLPFESSSSSYITINGNEETCGSSFSDTDSSVMASFDTAGFLSSDAFSGLFTPHEFDDFFGASHVTMQARDLDVQEENAVWDWSVFLGDPETEERD